MLLLASCATSIDIGSFFATSMAFKNQDIVP